MTRYGIQSEILSSIMEDLNSDYNIGMVREAIRTYLDCMSNDELNSELEDRVNFGLIKEQA